MTRVQIALNVEDLDAAVDFYSRLFGTLPHKRRPGYANFAVEEPPLKLVLIEGEGPTGTINHLGVEVASSQEVKAAADRLAVQGLATEIREDETCCYATQDKVWVTGADATRWEVYTVTDDTPAVIAEPVATACCAATCCA